MITLGQLKYELIVMNGCIYAHIQNVSAQNVSLSKILHTKRLRNRTSP
jgi:hypothetical protein